VRAYGYIRRMGRTGSTSGQLRGARSEVCENRAFTIAIGDRTTQPCGGHGPRSARTPQLELRDMIDDVRLCSECDIHAHEACAVCN